MFSLLTMLMAVFFLIPCAHAAPPDGMTIVKKMKEAFEPPHARKCKVEMTLTRNGQTVVKYVAGQATKMFPNGKRSVIVMLGPDSDAILGDAGDAEALFDHDVTALAGPSVTFTALASVSARLSRASPENRTSFAAIVVVSFRFAVNRHPESNMAAFSETNLQFVVSATDTNTVLDFGAENDIDYFGLDDVELLAILPPVFQSVTCANGAVTLQWSALSGLAYQVQYVTNLAVTNWINLGGPSPPPAASSPRPTSCRRTRNGFTAWCCCRRRDPSCASVLSGHPFQRFPSEKWSGRWDLNPRPLGPEPSALPSYATPRHDRRRAMWRQRRGIANRFGKRLRSILKGF